jgi:hypothetical protein
MTGAATETRSNSGGAQSVRDPYFTMVLDRLAALGHRMSADQRQTAIRQAARIYSDKSNCCIAM